MRTRWAQNSGSYGTSSELIETEKKGPSPWGNEPKCQLPRVSFSGLLSPVLGRNGDQGL